MSHSTTSGGGRVCRRLRAIVRISPPVAQAGADGAPQVGQRSQRVGPLPPRPAQVERQGQPPDLPLGLLDLRGAHRLEVHPLQPFLVGDGQHRVLHRRVLRRFRRLPRWLPSPRRRGGCPAAGAFGLLLLLRVQQRHRGGLARRRWDRARTARRPGRTPPGARGGAPSRCAARCAPGACRQGPPGSAPAARRSSRPGRPAARRGAAAARSAAHLPRGWGRRARTTARSAASGCEIAEMEGQGARQGPGQGDCARLNRIGWWQHSPMRRPGTTRYPGFRSRWPVACGRSSAML